MRFLSIKFSGGIKFLRFQGFDISRNIDFEVSRNQKYRVLKFLGFRQSSF
jgi:hypothetical protein